MLLVDINLLELIGRGVNETEELVPVDKHLAIHHLASYILYRCCHANLLINTSSISSTKFSFSSNAFACFFSSSSLLRL